MKDIFPIDAVVKKLSFVLRSDYLNALAVQTGFVKRLPRKLDPKGVLQALLLRILHGAHTLSSLAMTIGLLNKTPVSKQALSQRLNRGETAVIGFLEGVLSHSLAQRLQRVGSTVPSLGLFRRILIHDSTSAQLPSQMAPAFPGSASWNGEATALVKIQAIYNVVDERFCWFHFSPFNANEQSMASTILEKFLQPGDLLIRDLGYFTFDALQTVHDAGAFFISRWKPGTIVSDLPSHGGPSMATTGERINLAKRLKKYPLLDTWVVFGAKRRMRVRLVAVPVPPAVAGERRRRARGATRKGKRPVTNDSLTLLGWNIFLLNVGKEQLSAEAVSRLYEIRWRIEIIFKAWKSHFHLVGPFPVNASPLHIRIALLALFILVTLFHVFVLAPCQKMTAVVRRYGGGGAYSISLLKLCRYFREQCGMILLSLPRPDILADQILYYCRYDNRHDRLNYHQKLLSLC